MERSRCFVVSLRLWDDSSEVQLCCSALDYTYIYPDDKAGAGVDIYVVGKSCPYHYV